MTHQPISIGRGGIPADDVRVGNALEPDRAARLLTDLDLVDGSETRPAQPVTAPGGADPIEYHTSREEESTALHG